MVTRAEFIAEARTWLGTPFHHQGRLKGVGVDCAGLVIGVARDLGLSTWDVDGYGMVPNGRHLRQLANSVMNQIPRAELSPGDVVLMKWVSFPQHVAIITPGAGLGGLGLLHSYAKIGKCLEHGLTQDWWDRIVQAYRIPGLED